MKESIGRIAGKPFLRQKSDPVISGFLQEGKMSRNSKKIVWTLKKYGVRYVWDKTLIKLRLRQKSAYINMPDKEYIEMMYKGHCGKSLDLAHPNTFNEKLNWLKLYDRKPEYSMMVDKFAVRKYVAESIGEEYLIPLVGGPWTRFEDIDFDKLPLQFVLKCTHDSGSIVICNDRNRFDPQRDCAVLKKRLHDNYYFHGREWAYKNVKPQIIAEQYMVDESGSELKDYKVFNFHGQPALIQLDYDRFVEHKRNLYSPNWDYMDVQYVYPPNPALQIPRPRPLDRMLAAARVLSKNIPFGRTDFYVIDDKLYFGEMTFFPEAGYGRFTPPEFDMTLGQLLHLPLQH
jgi:hypothetical protein